MKVFPCSTGICLGLMCILAIMQQHNVNALYTMNETCNYLSFGYIGDPNNCQGWGYCRDGALIQTGVCGDGYLYDSEQGICNYASSVSCHTKTSENICANTVAAEFVGDPNNCNRYCYCANNNAVQCNFCPANQVYDPDQTECVFSKAYTCPGNSICGLVQNNVYVGDPTICGNFIRCVGGTGQSLPCQSGGFFNPMTVSCELTSHCTYSPNGPNSIVPAAAGICQQYNGFGENYFPVANTCSNYWACSDARGPPTYGTCPFATQFDSATNECVSPVAVKCLADRCANINLPMVAVPGNQCQSYQVCKNQQAAPGEIYSCAEAYPNSNYKYFDEIVQACVATLPNFAVCQGT